MSQVFLQQAIAAIKSGRKAEARRLLVEALAADARNTQAWLWMTEAVESEQERLRCLQKVLEIDPLHPGALRGMQLLQARSAAAPPAAPPPDSTAAEEGAEEEVEPEQEALAESQPPVTPDELKAMVAALQAEDAGTRAEAAETLVKLGRVAVRPLATALRSMNLDLRQAAAEALGQIGDPRAIRALAVASRGRGKRARLAAAQALGQIGDPRAVEPLIAALEDQDSDVRQVAAGALRKIGPPALRPLAAALQGSNNRSVHKAAAGVLASMGAPAVDVLLPVLQHWDKHVRQVAAEALDELGWQPDSGKSEAIYRIAKDEWERCAEIGAPALELLIAVMQDLDSSVRLGAITALEKSADPRAAESLVTAMRDKDSKVRQASAEALVRVGQAATEPLLDGLRRWNSHHIRQRIADVLDEIGWQPGQDETAAVYWIAKGEWDKCAGIGPAALGPLVATLRDPDSGVRWAAADLLDQLEWRPADSEIGATYWIAKTDWNKCVHIGQPAVGPLIAALRDREAWIQQAAVGALERIGTPEATEAVEDWRRQRIAR
ncbi:MAG: HEAT repeat domain-containing protein [Thermoflexales bacterium]|nr:HEAT repeat domain-containing protein [Thermoflexales bacterium]